VPDALFGSARFIAGKWVAGSVPGGAAAALGGHRSGGWEYDSGAVMAGSEAGVFSRMPSFFLRIGGGRLRSPRVW